MSASDSEDDSSYRTVDVPISSMLFEMFNQSSGQENTVATKRTRDNFDGLLTWNDSSRKKVKTGVEQTPSARKAERDRKAAEILPENRHPRAIFINNISYKVNNDRDVSSVLEREFGPVQIAKIGKRGSAGLGFGFVVFVDESSAKKCLEADTLRVGKRKWEFGPCDKKIVEKWVGIPVVENIPTTSQKATMFKPRSVKK